jgi:hypothetical protein
VSDVLHAPPSCRRLEEGRSGDPVVLERGRNRGRSTDHRQGPAGREDVADEVWFSAHWRAHLAGKGKIRCGSLPIRSG